MTKKWKYNNLAGKYKSRGEQIIHSESGAFVGTVFPASSEIVADIVANVAEGSDEVEEILNNL